MLKLTVAMVALVLAGTASAGWRDLRVDGSSEEAFAKSLEAFQDKLSPARRYVFGEALKDIWIQGEKAAAAERRAYADEDYYAQLDGLSYEEIVTFTDPSGDTARDRYRVASLNPSLGGRGPSQSGLPPPPSQFPQPWGQNGRERGWTDLKGSQLPH